MRFIFTLSLLFAFAPTAFTQNFPPVVNELFTNTDQQQRILRVTYSVSDPENDSLEVIVQFSNNSGRTYNLTLPASGDLGFPVLPGAGKTIEVDLNPIFGQDSAFWVRLVVLDRKPFDVNSLVALVDSNRLHHDLDYIEGVRHRSSGATHLEAVRDSLRAQFYRHDLHVQEHTFPYSGATGVNLTGSVPGITSADTVVIIDAHYDTVFNSPGADDNGSGTAGVIEAVRTLSRFPADRTVRFIGFDLEEAGLVGSTRYVSEALPANEFISGVLNFEMIGFYSDAPNSQTLPAGFNILFPDAYNAVAAQQFRGNFITNVGNTASSALVDLFAQSAATYIPNLRTISIKAPGNSQIAPDLRRSDHAPFWDAGFPALMITDGANFRNPCYHTAMDTADQKLSYAFMSDVLRATLATAAQLAGARHGDWAIAPFFGLVQSKEATPEPCALKVYRKGTRLSVDPGNCSDALLILEIFNAQGALLQQSRLPGHPGPQWVDCPGLASGMYFVRAGTSKGVQTVQVWF